MENTENRIGVMRRPESVKPLVWAVIVAGSTLFYADRAAQATEAHPMDFPPSSLALVPNELAGPDELAPGPEDAFLQCDNLCGPPPPPPPLGFFSFRFQIMC